jgi:phage shock protein C
MGLYFLAVLIIKLEPAIPVISETEMGRGAMERLRMRYENMERRLRRIEAIITTSEFDWNRRLNTWGSIVCED